MHQPIESKLRPPNKSSLHLPINAVNLSKNTNFVPKLKFRGVVLETLQQARQILGVSEFLLARHSFVAHSKKAGLNGAGPIARVYGRK